MKTALKQTKISLIFFSSLAITAKRILPDFSIESASSENLLREMIDSNFNFIEDTTYIFVFVTTRKKIQAVAGIFLYMPLTQGRHLMNAYILFQFGYFTLAWMKHSKLLSSRAERLHESY